ILATAVVPANVQEQAPAARLLEAAAAHGDIAILDIDRGYLSSPAVDALHRDGVIIHSRPWATPNKGLFTKRDFRIDVRRGRVTCPNGKTALTGADGKACFAVADCSRCRLKPRCTKTTNRSVSLHPMEGLLVQLRRRNATRPGRA